MELSSPMSRGNRVKILRKTIKMSRKALGLKYDIPPGTIQNWEDGRFGGLTEKGAKKVIHAFQQEGIECNLEWLMYGTGKSPLDKKAYLTSNLPEETERFSAESDIIARELEYFHQLNRNAVDAIMIDDSMEPYYYKGDHIAGRRYFGKEIKKLIGQNCIVQTQSGQVLVRCLHKGVEDDNYRLICCNSNSNNNTQNVENIKLFSAAPVVWIRRKNPLEENK